MGRRSYPLWWFGQALDYTEELSSVLTDHQLALES
jgi:hypothetical protein